MTATETTDMTLTHDGIEPVLESTFPSPKMTLTEIEAEIRDIHAKLDEQIRLLNVIVDNVKPMLDGIAASPLAAMFGVKS